MVHLSAEWLRHRMLGSMLGVGKTERRQSHPTMHTPVNSARLNTHHLSQQEVSVVSSSSPQVPCYLYFHFHSSLLSPASSSSLSPLRLRPRRRQQPSVPIPPQKA